MDLSSAAFIVGMVLGAGMITTACVVYLRDSEFGLGGSVLTGLGVVLAGMSVWSSVSFKASPEGLQLELARLEEKVEQIDAEGKATRARTDAVAGGVERFARTVTEELTSVAEATRTGNQQVLKLSETLAARRTIEAEDSRAIEQPLREMRHFDLERLQRAGREVVPPGG